MKYNYSMTENRYLTPPVLIQRGLQILSLNGSILKSNKFDLDVCCSNENVPAHNYYKYGQHDGLAEDWLDNNWCNPPFNECDKWVKKAYNEQLKGKNSILLIPVRTETAYWHNYILFNPDVRIFWLRKGYKFLDPDTKKEMGIFKNALAFVYFRGVKNESKS